MEILIELLDEQSLCCKIKLAQKYFQDDICNLCGNIKFYSSDIFLDDFMGY